MKFIKISAFLASAIISLSLGGVVAAQDVSDMSDRQLCELEAREAGMMDESDIQDYVEQCLEGLVQQEDSSGESRGGSLE